MEPGKLNLLGIMFCVSLATILISGTWTVGRASDLSLEYASGRLSASVSKASLQDVLEALSAKCDIKVFLDTSIKSKKMSTEFSNLPLEKAIAKLVNPHSSALLFGKRQTPAGRTYFHVTEVEGL